MPPIRYSDYKSSGKSRKKPLGAVSLGPALSEYEKMLQNNPGPGSSDSWVVDFMRNAPIPGISMLLQSPVGEALIGKAEQPIKNILEEGEDAKVIGPAIGALGRGFDVLSRGNYASANVAKELQGDPTDVDEDQSFLEQLHTLWRVGATIPGLALPEPIADKLGLAGGEATAGDLGRAAWEGLSGKEKTIFGQVLQDEGATDNLIHGAGGFGLDVLLDPTTYIGAGTVKGLTKGDEIIKKVADQSGVPWGPADNFSRLLDAPGRPAVGDVGRTGTPVETPIDGIRMPEREVPVDLPRLPQREVPVDLPRLPQREVPVDIRRPPPPPPRYDVAELPFAKDPVQFNEFVGKQGSLFDRRTKQGKEALKGIDWPKIDKRRIKPKDPDPRVGLMSDQDFTEEALDEAQKLLGHTPLGQLKMQFPEKADEIEWLQLFDPEMPVDISKNARITDDALGTTPPAPHEVELLVDAYPKSAADDWEVAKNLYIPDGPVNIPLDELASNAHEGLIKAPYEVPGIKGEDIGAGLPDHRALVNMSDDIPEPTTFDVGDVNKPWDAPGGKGPKGPRYNPGKLPGAGSVQSKADGYVALRFAGVDVARSHAAYKVGRSIMRPFFYGNGIARTLGKAFHMGAYLPDGTDQMLRVAENQQMAFFDRNMRAVTGHLGKLPLEERRQIGRAIADGTLLSEMIPSHTTAFAQSGEDFKQLAKGLMDEAWRAEDAQNISKGPYVDNYFRRQLLDEGKLSKEELRYAKAKNPDGTYKNSVQDLIDRDIEIELDINKVLVDRMAESARKLTRADFQWQAVARYGVPSSKVTPEMAKKLDLVPLDTAITKNDIGGKIYMPRHINEAMEWTSRMLNSDEVSNKVLRLVDQAIGEWKFLALATPGRHVRDTLGDIIMNAQAGVWNIFSYKKASRILGVAPPGGNLKRMDDAWVRQNIVTDTGAAAPLAHPVTSGKTVTIAGQDVPIERAWDMYVTSGAKAGQLSTEISRLVAHPKGSGEVAGRGVAKVPGQMYHATKRGLGRFSDKREDWSRIAHVVDYLDRKATKGKVFAKNGDLTSYGKKMVEEAGQSVRKWNIDYGNLTPFERNTVRRAIPFYTFMRHNIPRQVELLFTKPGFMALYPKGNNLIQGVFGTESGDDTLLPNWIRESAPFRIQHDKQEQKGALGWLLNQFGAEPGQQVLADPHSYTTPIGDFQMLNALADPEDPLKASLREIGSRLSPAIKVPAEAMFGSSVFNGAPINGNYHEYIMNQLPQGRAAHNIFEGGTGSRTNLARMLTGIPLRPITEDTQNNEAYRRELEAKRLFQDSLSRNLPSQYRVPRGAHIDEQEASRREREIYRNLMRAQSSD